MAAGWAGWLAGHVASLPPPLSQLSTNHTACLLSSFPMQLVASRHPTPSFTAMLCNAARVCRRARWSHHDTPESSAERTNERQSPRLHVAAPLFASPKRMGANAVGNASVRGDLVAKFFERSNSRPRLTCYTTRHCTSVASYELTPRTSLIMLSQQLRRA